jgi:hypothetical protein
MREIMLSKGLVVAVIILFLGVGIQPAIADIVKEPDFPNLNSNNLHEIDNVKPDLIVTNIIFRPTNLPPWPWASIYVRIRNIGNGKVNENEDIKISIIVMKWKYFRYLTYKTYDFVIEGGLDTGKRKEYLIDYDRYYSPGLYWFNCTVNPDKTIEESNYLNNYYSERDFHSIFLWIDFTWL